MNRKSMKCLTKDERREVIEEVDRLKRHCTECIGAALYMYQKAKQIAYSLDVQIDDFEIFLVKTLKEKKS